MEDRRSEGGHKRRRGRWREGDGDSRRWLHSLLKGAGECGDGGKAGCGLLFQRTQNDRIDGWAEAQIHRTGSWRWDHTVMIHHLLLCPQEGRAARQQLVGHNGQGILVGGWNRIAAPLFRGHVGGCPADSFAHVSVAGEACDPEVS